MFHTHLPRRSFLRTAGHSLLAARVAASLTGRCAAQDRPAAAGLTLNIRDFGATGDGAIKDTSAIQQAIDRCWVLGGGEVLVPAGLRAGRRPLRRRRARQDRRQPRPRRPPQ